MGKITSEDVKPILKKFQVLTGDKSKITSLDVSGPTKKRVPEETEARRPEVPETQVTEAHDRGPARPRPRPRRITRMNSVLVTKQIAQAFREELLRGGGAGSQEMLHEDTAEDYSTFRIPENTHAIAIDNSKVGQKQLGKFLESSGIPADHRIVVGDGYNQIMGIVEYSMNFIQNHDGYVLMIGKRARHVHPPRPSSSSHSTSTVTSTTGELHSG